MLFSLTCDIVCSNSDANTSSMLIIGGTLGQSILPALIGFIISFSGSYVMPWIIFLSCIMLCLLYTTVNYLRLGISSWSATNQPYMRTIDSSQHSSHPLASSFSIASSSSDEEDDNIEMSESYRVLPRDEFVNPLTSYNEAETV